jgi:hypothetical protein
MTSAGTAHLQSIACPSSLQFNHRHFESGRQKVKELGNRSEKGGLLAESGYRSRKKAVEDRSFLPLGLDPGREKDELVDQKGCEDLRALEKADSEGITEPQCHITPEDQFPEFHSTITEGNRPCLPISRVHAAKFLKRRERHFTEIGMENREQMPEKRREPRYRFGPEMDGEVGRGRNRDNSGDRARAPMESHDREFGDAREHDVRERGGGREGVVEQEKHRLEKLARPRELEGFQPSPRG